MFSSLWYSIDIQRLKGGKSKQGDDSVDANIL